MGRKPAGVDAIRIAWAKIASGQSAIALVGAAHNAERKEMLMLYECGGFNLKNALRLSGRVTVVALLWGRAGVFLVLESKSHAEHRGARPFARLVNVVSSHSSRSAPGDVERTLGGLWASLRGTENATRGLHGGDGDNGSYPGRGRLSVGTQPNSRSGQSARPSDISAKLNSL